MTALLAGWGGLAVPGREVVADDLESLTRGAVLSRGLGRSYGDSSLPARADDKIAASRLADRILAFDVRTGIVRAEAGLSLADLNRVIIPRGWFPPVTPGTKFVTLGGMVASDVHGKNHHREGCFGAHVRALRLRLADDSIVECGPTRQPDLFRATVGGMGLLGHILEVEFNLHRIPSPWLHVQSERVADIDSFLAALERAASVWPMTMGWIDCLSGGSSLGRGILMAGRWATPEEAKGRPIPEAVERSLPFELPNWVLNRTTAAVLNSAYYWSHFEQRTEQLVAPDPFFYPLDAVLHWNRAYGARGFTQFQCVLPRAAGAPAVRALLGLLARLGCASPLCVIKDCGPQGEGLLSFPLEGTSIAVDMAVNPDTQHVVDRLNELVIAAGGRIYLAKDRFTRREHFRAMEPRAPRRLFCRPRCVGPCTPAAKRAVRAPFRRSSMKVVILGGTSGMGREIARLLATRGDAVFLLGRDEADLARSAADLTARDPAGKPVGYALCDLESSEGFAPALDAADAALDDFDTVVVTAAMFSSQDALEADVDLTRRLLTVDFAHTVVFCEHARKRLLARGGGQLTVFSSVAGDRGRKPVAIYGAAKAGLSTYLEALDHKFHASGLSVVCVKPGFVKTGMTAGLRPPPFAGEPERVARDVVRAMDRRSPIVYTPFMWAWVMWVIRSLPRFVMRKISF